MVGLVTGQICLQQLLVSKTTLLIHTVAHSTRHFFRPKTKNHPIKKFLSPTVSWVKVVKNCKILTFKVNFLCQKWSKLSKNHFIEEYHFSSTFFVSDIFWQLNFWTTFFSKMMSNFWQLLLNWQQDLKTFQWAGCWIWV